jgi:purine nucleosidase
LPFDWEPGAAPAIPSQKAAAIDDGRLAPEAPVLAPQFIADAVLDHPGELAIITIGAMTNLAAALILRPEIAGKIAHVYSMAGARTRPTAEWNVRYDPAAVDVVARSGVPWTLIGAELGMQCRLKQEYHDALKAARLPHTELLLELIELYRKEKGGKLGVPFDPLTVAVCVDESLVELDRVSVSVHLEPEKRGILSETPGQEGPHRVATSVDAQRFLAMFIGRITENEKEAGL